MLKSITLFPHEARAAAAGTLRQLWRPVLQYPFDACGDGLDVAFRQGDLKPPFRPGDVLSCREAWRTEELESGLDGVRFQADKAFVEITNTQAASEKWMAADKNGRFGSKWRSPATMPAWAVRSWIKPVSVGVKRVQEMTEEDAKSWGCSHRLVPGWQYQGKQMARETAAVSWNSHFARRGLGWDKNPWCWTYTVEQAERSS